MSNKLEQPADLLDDTMEAPAMSEGDSLARTATSITPTSKSKSKTQKLSKLPTKTTPKSRKRKSRSSDIDDPDSDYRLPTPSSRKSSRKSSLESDPDGDYGPFTTPTRTMTRMIKPRFPHLSTTSDEYEYEDPRENICTSPCRYYEVEEMLECDGVDCERRKFHPGCVGFRSVPVLGDGRWWFCFECRKVEGKGMETNGVYVEGEEEDVGGE